MKIEFSKAKPYTPDFNDNKKLPEDQQIVCTLKPLKLNELLDIRDALQALNDGAENLDISALTTEKQKALIAQCGLYIPTHVEIKNLDDTTPQDVVDYAPFLGLAVELLFALVGASSPKEAAIKN